MSTIERDKEGIVWFEFDKQMITKSAKGWITSTGDKFNRVKLSNFIRNKAINNRSEVMHLRSILNRFFGYSLKYVI